MKLVVLFGEGWFFEKEYISRTRYIFLQKF